MAEEKNEQKQEITLLDETAILNFRKAYDWEHRGQPEKMRTPFAVWLVSAVHKAAENAAKYAETQAYNTMERNIFKIAKRDHLTPFQVAEQFGISLRK